ncbi:ankyrin repeat family protein [Tanacetum coccineum]|uniref:Ankyrin repeat family protein n=1 Tax=Tanacetum coccineum TaxID=301880 RepID=A0ABQ5DWJ3_9ASTR
MRLGETPLIHVARQGHTSTAKYLIGHGVNLALSSELGVTGLHHVAGIGHIELMELFLSVGVDVDSQSDSGTPLVWAAGHAQQDAVKLLLKHKADPNIETDDGVNLLLCTVAAGSLPCLELLIEVTQEAKEKAAEAKSRADAVLKHKEYSMALDAYTQTDARTCWELKPNWVKAWYREGLSLCLLQKVNFSKLGTNTLWRYYSNFNLGNIHSSPTKEQLVNAVQKHFESQVPLSSRNSLLEVEQDGFAFSMMKSGIFNGNYEQTHKEKIDYEKANMRKLKSHLKGFEQVELS